MFFSPNHPSDSDHELQDSEFRGLILQKYVSTYRTSKTWTW